MHDVLLTSICRRGTPQSPREFRRAFWVVRARVNSTAFPMHFSASPVRPASILGAACAHPDFGNPQERNTTPGCMSPYLEYQAHSAVGYLLHHGRKTQRQGAKHDKNNTVFSFLYLGFPTMFRHQVSCVFTQISLPTTTVTTAIIAKIRREKESIKLHVRFHWIED